MTIFQRIPVTSSANLPTLDAQYVQRLSNSFPLDGIYDSWDMPELLGTTGYYTMSDEGVAGTSNTNYLTKTTDYGNYLDTGVAGDGPTTILLAFRVADVSTLSILGGNLQHSTTGADGWGFFVTGGLLRMNVRGESTADICSVIANTWHYVAVSVGDAGIYASSLHDVTTVSYVPTGVKYNSANLTIGNSRFEGVQNGTVADIAYTVVGKDVIDLTDQRTALELMQDICISKGLV